MYKALRTGIMVAIVGVIVLTIFVRKSSMIHAFDVTTPMDALALFPNSVAVIEQRIENGLQQAHHQLDAIIAVPAHERTYANTMQPLDELCSVSDLAINAAAIATFDLVHPDAAMREAARAAVLKAQTFFIDHVSSNKKLYAAVKEYADTHAKKENLTAEQQYFIEETLKDFERAGLNLPEEDLQTVKRIKKELAALELEFDKNIAQDPKKITATADQLQGLTPEFVNALSKNEQGLFVLGTDYPTFVQVMENCADADTRQRMLDSYDNRAYPANKECLNKIIALRYELAQLLGFKSYADLELDSQMVQNVSRAHTFLDELYEKARKKAAQEFSVFTKHLPKSIQLTAEGKLQAWDSAYVKNYYKKTQLHIDENAIAQYFPMDHTIKGLLSVYEQFLNLEFKQVPISDVWDATVQLIEVVDKNNNRSAGYLFLDLFPRDNKYTHACEHTIVPVTYDQNGKPNKGVAIVIANFPKPTAERPSLLHFKDVNTFFHEFGHAMHALLGRTRIASQAGTNVKRDFVELPSQMLEEWLWDPTILKHVSSHYKTGQSLPDELIQKMLAARTFDSGNFIIRQLFFANLSLAYFENGPQVDLDGIMRQLFDEFMYKIEFMPSDHFYASFGHLIGYGARYYGYMWSKVFAHDLFGEIKKSGLLNPEIGKRYTDTVIGKGGSKDPNDLLKDFLGREPNQDAFLHDMGLQ